MMTMRTWLALGVAWGLMVVATPAHAQQPSLAEVARQEAARRKAVEASKKVYTNGDLAKGRPLTTGAAAKVAEAAGPDTQGEGAAGGAAAGDTPALATDVAEAKPVRNDDPRLIDLRLRLASASEAAKAALTDIDQSNVTIVNLFDEAQRNAAVAARDARLADYRKHQGTIEAINKEIAEVERTTGQPPAQAPR